MPELHRARSPRARVWSCALILGLGLGLPAAVSAQADSADPNALKRMSLEELMALEVTSASRTPEPFSQAAAAIQVITREQIRRSGATTVPEALRLATNLAVSQKNSNTWAISARGFNTDLANKLLVLIDGRAVYTPLFSGVFWDRQDYLLEDVERIEVISGPGGTLWGANAVNGVINIITRSAKDSQGLYAEGGAGTQVDLIAGGRYGGRLGANASYRAYGKYFSRDVEALPDGSDASDAWDKSQGGFRVDADASPRDQLTLQGDIYEGDEDVTAGTAEMSGGNVLGRWTRALSSESEISLQLYYDRTHLSLPTPAQTLGEILASPAGTLTDDLDTYDLDVQHRFAAGGRNRIVWGGGYRFTHNVVGNAPGLAFTPPTLNRNLYNVFVQDEIAVASGLDLTLGTKVEHNDYTGFELEPNARLRWTAQAGHMVWGAASRAVRAPSRVDRHESLPTPGFGALLRALIVGNETFVSETVIAYELGYRAQVGTKVAASVSTFYNRYGDLRSTKVSAPDPVTRLPFPFTFANDLEATTYGAEVVANVRPLEALGLRAGYTFLHEDVRVSPGGTDFNNRLNETADPEHQLFLSSSIDLPYGIELDGSVRRIGSFVYNTSGEAATVPSYTEADVRLAWRPSPIVELSIDGRNLLHDQHLEYVISSPNPRAEIRRSVQGKVAIRW
jgi:iron complex outermembrane receptor protein